jgi:hypothetical protein
LFYESYLSRRFVFWDRLFFSATTTALLALFPSVVGLSVLT